MGGRVLIFLWIACPATDEGGTTSEPTVQGTDQTVTETGTVPETDDTDPPTGTDTDTDTDTGTGTTTTPHEPCAVDPALTVTVTSDQPWHENELLVELSLSAPASAVVQCTLDADKTEIHLVESADVVTDHEIRLTGLLADSDYSCAAAAICPATADPTLFAVHTGPKPPGLASIGVSAPGDHGDEYVLVNQSDDCSWQYQRLLVVDRDGGVRWWYTTPQFVGPSVDFRYHGDDQFAWGGGWGPNSNGRPRKMDLFDGEVYDSAAAMPDVNSSDYHHDGKQLPDGRMLTLELITVDNGGFGFDGFQVRRIDPVTNTVDFEYSAQRAYDEGHLPGGFGDAWHPNWVDIVDETLYVSLCYLSRVIAVDVATGDFLWSFGSNQDFELFDVAGNELGSDQFMQCEHGLEYTEDDRLFVYDNGNVRGYSRAAAYQLDPANLTATLLWTWSEPDWWESTLGSIDELPSGNVLIGAGHAECFSSNPGDNTTILEVDPVSGDKVWEMKYTNIETMAYRADWADPCALFDNAKYCPAVATRAAELADLLTP